MALSKKMEDALNEQIKAEMWSSNLYLSMSVYLAGNGLDGFGKWMRAQSREELDHAYLIIDYIQNRGGCPAVPAIEAVPARWDSVEKVFDNVYTHEVHVTSLINNLMDIAVEENDRPTQDFLWTFIREQVEEEATAQFICDKLRVMGTDCLAFLDAKYGERQ